MMAPTPSADLHRGFARGDCRIGFPDVTQKTGQPYVACLFILSGDVNLTLLKGIAGTRSHLNQRTRWNLNAGNLFQQVFA